MGFRISTFGFSASCLLFALCLLTSALDAQSFFSMRGLGEEVLSSEAASTALGRLVTTSTRNPAYPIGGTRTAITFSALTMGNYAVQEDRRRLVGDARPEYLKVRVPMPLGLRLGLGWEGRYNQNFDVYSDSYPEYRRRVTGRGGVFGLNAALAKNLFRTASVALEYSRLFGGSHELWRFDAYQGNYVTMDTILYDYGGNALKGGLLFSTGPVTLGGFYERVLDFGLNSRVRTHGSVAESLVNRGLEIPAQYGAGLVITPNQQLKLFLDAAQQGRAAPASDSEPSMFRGSLRAALGVQYVPDEVHPLRLGLAYHDWYLLAAGGKPVKELALTGGSSLPITDLGSFDFALELVRRTGGALTENIVRATFTLYFEEPWKVRRRRWGY